MENKKAGDHYVLSPYCIKLGVKIKPEQLQLPWPELLIVKKCLELEGSFYIDRSLVNERYRRV